MTEENDIKTTCLHPRHMALGAVMSPFAGFDMPISYEGITEEHQAVRTACGMFDVSHMGEVLIEGKDAMAFVNHIFTNDVTRMADRDVVYGMMLHPHGGVVDDLLVYRFTETTFLLVINASNIAKDIEWIRANTDGYDVTVTDLSDVASEIAVQGPLSEEVVRSVLGIEGSDLKFYTFKQAIAPDGSPLLVSRTGYTGEDGFEIYGTAYTICDMWDRLIESGRCKPCGLGCRDTLRFEAGLPLYGDELADDITPIEAGLSMFVKIDKPDGFIGRDACAAQKAQGPARKSVGLELHDRAVARHGAEVIDPATGNVIGVVTTGYRGISTDRSIAVALIDSHFTARGTEVAVKVRRKVFPATVTGRRFVDTHYKK